MVFFDSERVGENLLPRPDICDRISPPNRMESEDSLHISS